MEQIYEKLTKIAGHTRELTNTTDKMGLDAINENLGTVVSDVNTQDDLIEQIAAALDGKVGGNPEMEDGLVTGEITEYANRRVTTVASYAFYYKNIKLIDLPACTYIGSSAFFHCEALERAIFPECVYINNGAFSNCSKLTSAVFPACSSIGSYAFYYCQDLTSIYFPTCTHVGSSAFATCTSLESFILPAVSTVGPSAFSGCTKLTTADFGGNNSVNTIYSYAFYNCKSLSTLILRYSSLATLNATTAFMNTPLSSSTYLGYFGSIYVPSSLVEIYKSATNWTAYADRITAITEDELNGGEG